MKKVIILSDLKRNRLGQIVWTDEGKADVEFIDAYKYLSTDFGRMLQDIEGRQTLPFRKSIEKDGNRIELLEQISITDEKFPLALVDLINKTKFQSQRVFAYIDHSPQEGVL